MHTREPEKVKKSQEVLGLVRVICVALALVVTIASLGFFIYQSVKEDTARRQAQKSSANLSKQSAGRCSGTIVLTAPAGKWSGIIKLPNSCGIEFSRTGRVDYKFGKQIIRNPKITDCFGVVDRSTIQARSREKERAVDVMIKIMPPSFVQQC